MKRLLIAAAAALAFASSARACLTCERYPVFNAQHQAPSTRTQEAERLTPAGCMVLSNMAVTARALSAEKVDRDAARRAMARMYSAYTADTGPGGLLDRVVSLGYGRAEAALELGGVVYLACLKTGGDRDATLGPAARPRPALGGVGA